MTVLGTAGSDEGMASVQKVGAHHVFNHSSEDYTEKIMVNGLRNCSNNRDILFL